MRAVRAGFVGIGNMGAGMASNLSKAVSSLLVFDADAAKCNQMRDALPDPMRSRVAVAKSVAEVAERSDVVCLALAKEEVCEEVLFGSHGIANVWGTSSRIGGKIVIEHGTFSKRFVADCGDRLARKGVHYLDAPVSGGPERARLGALSIMVGGDAAVFQQALPLLESMGSSVIHMGETGAGIAAKLVNQLLVGVHAQAASEAFSLAEDLGVTNMEALLQLLNSAWGNSVILQKCGEQYLRAQREGPESIMHSAAPLRNMIKDFDCIERSVSSSSLELPCMRKTHAQMKLAERKGFAEAEFVVLQRLLRERS